ncbi:helix-turn-helix domain-containing protein [Clostridium sp. AL.422]|uniref:helix-turn-helix domain-containing protein n=1 Tax=Clostridium TaxID=1485 RepID=UPI00293DDE55|nr:MULTISPECIES: helix-turn-helix domain-containing protein [unclassified Clostridium]MDV4151975.1 helix-turn-helix domain-containing protein [Clostridium sp. AL.422]
MITVSDFIKNSKIDAKLLYGLNGSEKIISSVTIEDIPEILDWSTRGELIISGKLLKKTLTFGWIDNAIKLGIVGIVSKDKFISAIDKCILSYCEEKSFPIISIPEEYCWSEIITSITNLITEKVTILHKDTIVFENTLIKLLTQNSSLSKLSESIKKEYNFDFAFLNKNFNLITNSTDDNWIKRTENINEFTVTEIKDSFSFEITSSYVFKYINNYLQSEKKCLYIFPIIVDNNSSSYICVLLDYPYTNLNRIQISRIQQLILVTTLIIKQEKNFNEELRKTNFNIYEKLSSSSEISIEKAHFLLAPLNKNLYTYYYVVFINNPLDDFLLYNEINQELKNSLTYINHILHFNNDKYYILLIPDIIPDFDGIINNIYNIYKKVMKCQDVFFGISTVSAINNVSKLQKEAMYANKVAYILNNKHIIKYEDLGIIKMFIDNDSINVAYLENIYNSYIRPLVDHDNKYNSQLLITLQHYIKCNCNKSDTANSFYIHINTLRQRIACINKILNIDIDLPEDLFQIQLALKVKLLYDLELLKLD